MPNTREKLIEMSEQLRYCAADSDCTNCKRWDKASALKCVDSLLLETAELLESAANGVTVQEWIPVSERLPEDVYGKDREQIVVLVCTKSGKVSQCARMADYECIADETLTKVEWIKNGKFYWSKNKAVTHWMPLPEPPKGE